MSEIPQPAADFVASRKNTAFEGRAELDQAWRCFRKALARLLREGRRSDAETLAKLAPIAAEAAEVLLRLAADAESAVSDSRRNRELLERDEARLRRTLQRGVRQGVPQAAGLLRQLDGGRPDDAA
ncbi:hypothetical protein ACFQ61_04810 [Streptomyces sp. NPDC056500]|uniref:hypothetical protein n=1 Tax=Streptomyces sp. NPDC056500 TaxID=3345840 RepID=UPI0036B3F263